MKEKIPRLTARLAVVLTAAAILGTTVYTAVLSPATEQAHSTEVLEATESHKMHFEAAASDEETKEPVIEEITEEPEEPGEPLYTDDDLFCLAAVIYAEAGSDSCSDKLRMAVGNVVLNRTKSKYYPNTIRSVIEQPMQYGWLSRDGISFPKGADDSAVCRAYDCAERLLEGETVLPENVIFQAEFKQGDGVYEEIDGVYFCMKN